MERFTRKALMTLSLLTMVIGAQDSVNVTGDSTKTGSDFAVRGVAEFGFLGVFAHDIQFSNSGTPFDYKNDGGQNNLYAVTRLSLELDIHRKNTFYLLYQPLSLETASMLDDTLIVDDEVFLPGTPMNYLYNFPFYRFSYTRTVVDKEQFELAVGASIQIRNATIQFASQDGTQFRDNNDVGIVPLLKLRMIGRPTEKFWLGLEVDGIYAPVSYLNGSDDEIVGALLDASLRTGIDLTEKTSVFLNYRYLGGGATGTDNDHTGPGDGYVDNWLHFYTVTAGLQYEFGWDKSAK